MSTSDHVCPPISSDEWPQALSALKGGFADRLNVYRVMAHHPDLLEAWAPLRAHVVTENALGAERQEVTILRVAARLDAPYEWAHHVDRAGKIGFSPERIASIAGDLERMTAEDAVIAAAVDALLNHARLDAEQLEALTRAVGKEGVFDLMATVGFYVTLGFIVNSFDVPLDDDIRGETIPASDAG